VTLDGGSVDGQIRALVGAIKGSGLRAIFTMANADAQGVRINAILSKLCAQTPVDLNGFPTWTPSLSRCCDNCALMVGNFLKRTDRSPLLPSTRREYRRRQRGRVRAANVIDVPCSQKDILRGIQKACSRRFRISLRGMKNPYQRYHDGKTSEESRMCLNA